jgi:hypothetical protein
VVTPGLSPAADASTMHTWSNVGDGMRVYDLRVDPFRQARLAVPGRADRDWLHQMVRGVALTSRWDPIVVRPVLPPRSALADLMRLDTVDCALSATAARALGDLLEGHAELLPLGGLPPSYSLLNVTTVIDALDLAEAKVAYTADGRLDRVVRHAFVPRLVRGVPLLKLPQRPRSAIYVNQDFVDRVAEAELTGFSFGSPLWTDEPRD